MLLTTNSTFVSSHPDTANAFVLPGGKVFVFSGILPLVRNDSGLAAVLGHEIAHNVAGHVGERLSQSIGTNVLLYSLIILFGAFGAAPFAVQLLGGAVMDVAFGRPMSRLQESEADYIGLMMMAEACYDPREASAFWGRMNKAQSAQPPEWMSTHPSVSQDSVFLFGGFFFFWFQHLSPVLIYDVVLISLTKNQSRIEKIQQWLPKALEKRESSDCQSTIAFADLFRRAMEKGVLIEA